MILEMDETDFQFVTQILCRAKVTHESLMTSPDLCMAVRDRHREKAKMAQTALDLMHDAKKQLPNPDPDWEEICAKCSNGEVEPDCEYYGEPCGCNSPIYQHYPKKQLDNAAKLREAMVKILEIATRLGEKAYTIACIADTALAESTATA